MRFDRIAVIDWSAASVPSPARPSPDAIWLAVAAGDQVETTYFRTRASAVEALQTLARESLSKGERLLIGADFPFGYPRGLAAALTGRPSALALWDWIAARINDDPDNRNNRFELAATINQGFPGMGPFWGRPAALDLPALPERGTERHGHGLPERRLVEQRVPRAQSCWKLYTTGSVGSQAILGIAALQKLRRSFGTQLSVWPFEPLAQIVLAEVYPSLLAGAVTDEIARTGAIRDEAQVRLLARALMALGPDIGAVFSPDASAEILSEEGWILGVGAEAQLKAATTPRLAPPRLRNDCFALPAGVNWTPVDEALALLRARLEPVVETETVDLARADSRVLARDAVARRSNPPAPNSAVDGYGFAHDATGEGPQLLPLVPGRAAAGVPFQGAVTPGHALRILTGAILPQGVDTVVLEEDCSTDGQRIAFEGPVRKGANTRRAGEDLSAGDRALPAGHVLRAPDLALLAATGLGTLDVFRRLRVGVLSTGDEIEPDLSTDLTKPGRIHDANRPMLLALAARWGYTPVDLGHVGDDRRALAERLDEGAQQADVILTSGGASAGDEDHVSALLREAGTLQSWRIAIKPGRPLALALWQGVPVFGLPGNPVAAFVCTLIFGRPALSMLSGAGWTAPMGFDVPAAFEKRKKAGRREYLRARLTPEGQAEVFRSEGSGRISGLSWAEGLVELDDGARHVKPGDLVRFLPYGSFGL
ncbi:gephyrin-like molybdotransferase Glp [Halodurantibacterium flavum]|uniref:Molybdopterin molybdenumtransferase n=1 Tax=Halodurantibacterium flavum TaxID=1382802 RepID=A0ABW4S9P7_9RHOB